jgi:AcrR family transcriptional regulator
MDSGQREVPMMGVSERKEREKEQRRNDIIDAAEKLFFSKGVENTSMDEIAAATELSKGTLYLYFKSKNDMFHAIICRALHIMFNLFSAATENKGTGLLKLQAVGTAYFKFFQDYPDYFEALMHQEKLSFHLDEEPEPYVQKCVQIGDQVFGFMQEIIELGIKDGSMPEDLDPISHSFMLWGFATGILQLAKTKGVVLHEVMGIQPEDLVSYSLKILVKMSQKEK